MHIQNGKLLFSDKSEVTLWGVNLELCLSSEHERMKRHGRFIPFFAPEYQTMIRETFDELEILGVQVIRLPLAPGDLTDEDGDLVENEWLDTLDFVMKEAQVRGIYVNLALFDADGKAEDASFVRDRDEKEIFFNDRFQRNYEQFFRQLLNRRNPYDGSRQYQDNPAWVIVEPLGAPVLPGYGELKERYPEIDSGYRRWLSDKERESSEEAFIEYGSEQMGLFIKRLQVLLEEEGAEQVMSWVINGTGVDARFLPWLPGVLEDSECYLYSFSAGSFGEQGETESPSTFVENLHEMKRERELHGWQLEAPYEFGYARIVNKFDVPDGSGASLYPVMAKWFRSLGVQVATLWTYRSTGIRSYYSGPHNFNLKTTPRKAAGYLVAREVFRKSPRFIRFSVSEKEVTRIGGAAISFATNSSAVSNESLLIHAGTMDSGFVSLPESPMNVMGVGSSPFIRFEGPSLYYLNKDISVPSPPQDSLLDRFRALFVREAGSGASYYVLRIFPECHWSVDPDSGENDVPPGQKLAEFDEETAYPLHLYMPCQGSITRIVRMNKGQATPVSFSRTEGALVFQATPGLFHLIVE